MNPLSSIIIVTYNRAQTLARAIDGVLNQTFSDFELIIIDDSSIDDTEKIVKDFQKTEQRIHYYKNEKKLGIAKSRNRALTEAQGKYIAVLDSDDWWLDQNKLKKQVDFLENNPDFGLVGTGVIFFNQQGQETGRTIKAKTDDQIRQIILKTNPIFHSSAVFNRNLALETGLYPENHTVGEDYDLWLKIGLKAKLANLAEFITAYQKHDQGITWSKKLSAAKDHLKIIKPYKKNYPNYFPALLKAYLRIIKSLF